MVQEHALIGPPSLVLLLTLFQARNKINSALINVRHAKSAQNQTFFTNKLAKLPSIDVVVYRRLNYLHVDIHVLESFRGGNVAWFP
jgi:hypothetical protein